MIDAQLLYATFQFTIDILAMILNVILLYLAFFQSPKFIQVYTILIANMAVTDFFAAFFNMAVQNRMIPTGPTLAYVSNGFCKNYSPNFCFVSYSIMSHFISHSNYSLVLSYAYRYYILRKPAPSQKTLAFILFLVYIPSFVQMVTYIIAQGDPKRVTENVIAMYPEYNLTGLVVSGVEDIFHFCPMVKIVQLSVMIIPIYIAILTLRHMIIKMISSQITSEQAKKMHKQLLVALTYQAAIPGIYCITVIFYTIEQLEIYHHPIMEHYMMTGVVFIPLVSPLANFYFVAPYRKFLKSLFQRGAVSDSKMTYSRSPNNMTSVTEGVKA